MRRIFKFILSSIPMYIILNIQSNYCNPEVLTYTFPITLFGAIGFVLAVTFIDWKEDKNSYEKTLPKGKGYLV